MKLSYWLRTALVSASLITVAFPALALDLQQARAQGAVAEKRSGYIAAVKPSPEVNALVSEVNTRRQQEYQRISKENGQSVDVVAKLAAAQVIQKLEPGNLYEGETGGIQKK